MGNSWVVYNDPSLGLYSGGKAMKTTIEKAYHKMLQATSEEKYRIKLYKAGRLWLAAGMTTLAFGLVSMTSPVQVSADDTTPTTATESSESSSSIHNSQVVLDNTGSNSTSSEDTTAEQSSSDATSTPQSDSSSEKTTSGASHVTKSETSNTDSDNVSLNNDSKTTTDTMKTAVVDSSSSNAISESSDSQNSDESMTVGDVTTGVKSDAVNSGTDSHDLSSTQTVHDSVNTIASHSDNQPSVELNNDNVSTAVNETDLGVTSETTIESIKAIAAQEYAETGVAQLVTAQLPTTESTATTSTTFGVTDPTYPKSAVVVQDNANFKGKTDYYLFYELHLLESSNGWVGGDYVAFSADRSDPTSILVTVLPNTRDKILAQYLLSATMTVDPTTGLTIYESGDTLSLVTPNSNTAFNVVTNVNGSLNGETGSTGSGLGVFSDDSTFLPQVVNQTTSYTSSTDGQILADSQEQSGLTGQAYTTAAPADITGYTLKTSGTSTLNQEGDLSPFVEGSTFSKIVYFNSDYDADTEEGITEDTINYIFVDTTGTDLPAGTAVVYYTYGSNITSNIPESWVAASEASKAAAELEVQLLTDSTDSQLASVSDAEKAAASSTELAAPASSVVEGSSTSDSATTSVSLGTTQLTLIQNPDLIGKVTSGFLVKNPYIVPQTTQISYLYDPDPETVTVNYIDDENNTIAKSTTFTGTYNTSVTIPDENLEYIPGYVADDDNQTTYKATALDGSDSVTLRYKINTEEVGYVQFVTADGNVIGTTQITGTYGKNVDSDTISLVEKDFLNNYDYQLVNGATTNLLTDKFQDNPDQSTTVNLFTVEVEQPTSNVTYTVNFVNYNGQTIESLTQQHGAPGDTIDLTAPAGYVWTPGTEGQIDLKDVPNGVYTVTITTPKGAETSSNPQSYEGGVDSLVEAPRIEQITVSYKDYTGKEIGTATVADKIGDDPTAKIAATVPAGYVLAPGETDIEQPKDPSQPITVTVTTPKSAETVGNPQFASTVDNPTSVTEMSVYDNAMTNTSTAIGNDLVPTHAGTSTDVLNTTSEAKTSSQVVKTFNEVTTSTSASKTSAHTNAFGGGTDSITEVSESQNEFTKVSHNEGIQTFASSSTLNNKEAQSNNSATKEQRTLPQTNESQNTVWVAGLISLATAMIGLIGLKKRKHENN